MKLLLLGNGAVGNVLLRLLENEKDIDEIVSADILFKKETKVGKVRKVYVDLKDTISISKVISENNPDLVVNVSSSLFNLNILDSCHKNKTNYMDLASLWEEDKNSSSVSPYKIEQFDFKDNFKDNSLLGLIDAGVSPGMTNLFVRECADYFDKLKDVKIRLIDYSGSDELSFSWSKQALLDEIASKPLVYRNGKFIVKEPFSDEEEYVFPKPYGKKKVSLICQDEIGTIPFFIKLDNLDIKDYDNQIETHRLLYKLGMFSKEKVDVHGVKVVPLDLINKVLPEVSFNSQDEKFKDAQFGFVIEALGIKDGKKKIIKYSVLFPKQSEINKLGLNANFVSYPTALSAKIFILLFNKIKIQGIIPPEALEKDVREKIISHLKNVKGIEIRKEII
jgi:saccharopine dehydrogenase-like NADP-dependent oxidoreductase